MNALKVWIYGHRYSLGAWCPVTKSAMSPKNLLSIVVASDRNISPLKLHLAEHNPNLRT